MNGFLIGAIDRNDKKFYAMNTSPIIWTSNINEAKIFESYRFIKSELEDNFATLSIAINYSNIHSVWIFEYLNNEEIGREKFI